jgi:hypothetical protein
MIGGSLLNVVQRGFFNWNTPSDNGARGNNPLSVIVNADDGSGKKRRRNGGEKSDPVGGSRTPTLVSPSSSTTRRFSSTESDVLPTQDANDRPLKRFRGHNRIIAVPNPVVTDTDTAPKKKEQPPKSEFLSIIPEDVVAHCLSFLGTAEDRFSLQTTCKKFRDISNSDEMLAKVNVGGEKETAKHGIIQDHDTPATAASALSPFARAGNLEALYM